MSGSRERAWEREWERGRKWWNKITDQEATKYFVKPEEATPEDIQTFRWAMGELGSPKAQLARGQQLAAGRSYVETHREKIIQEHDGEWIAATKQGVVASNVALAELGKQLDQMARNPRFAAYIEHCGPITEIK